MSFPRISVNTSDVFIILLKLNVNSMYPTAGMIWLDGGSTVCLDAALVF